MHRNADGTYRISSGGFDLPGVYADRRTALYAFLFSNEELASMAMVQGASPPAQRVITLEMLRALRRAKRTP